MAWEFKWVMEFNTKCQVIHNTASRAPLKTEYMYILHGQVLESNTSARYLGMDVWQGDPN